MALAQEVMAPPHIAAKLSAHEGLAPPANPGIGREQLLELLAE